MQTLRGEDSPTLFSLLDTCQTGMGSRLLKRWLLGTHHGAIDPTHLDYYLDEFVFRFNRRTSKARGLLFYRLLEQAVRSVPVTYTHIRDNLHGSQRQYASAGVGS